MKLLWDIYTKYRHLQGEFFRFAIVGATNTSLDFVVYVWMTRWSAHHAFWSEHYISANWIAFGAGVVTSFVLNNWWTFRKDHRDLHRKSARFLIVVGAALAMNTALLYSLTELVGLHDIVSKLIATGAVAGFNFVAYRVWAFK